MTLAVAAREYVWLWDNRHGISANEIAVREGVSVRRVKEGIASARRLDRPASSSPGTGAVRAPRLVPIFPLGSYTPRAECAHHRPIRVGSVFCCMVCHQSGMDGHPALQRDPRTDPAPEPKPAPAPAKASRETRKQRRAREFARQSPDSC